MIRLELLEKLIGTLENIHLSIRDKHVQHQLACYIAFNLPTVKLFDWWFRDNKWSHTSIYKQIETLKVKGRII